MPPSGSWYRRLFYLLSVAVAQFRGVFYWSGGGLLVVGTELNGAELQLHPFIPSFSPYPPPPLHFSFTSP